MILSNTLTTWRRVMDIMKAPRSATHRHSGTGLYCKMVGIITSKKWMYYSPIDKRWCDAPDQWEKWLHYQERKMVKLRRETKR